MEKNIKIIIADDHDLFIQGIESLLKSESNLHIIEKANNGKELLDILQMHKPDIVLLDINMPYMNGIDTCRYIKQSYPLIKVIMLSTYKEEHLIEKAKQNGANGYLLKDCNKEELLQTIYLINEGKTSFPYRFADKSLIDNNDVFGKQFQLTKRELEILRLLKLECTNQTIADKLFLSVYTVETHRKNIKQKLGITKPSALLKFLLENEF